MPNERPTAPDRPARSSAAPATRPTPAGQSRPGLQPPQPQPRIVSATLHLHGPEDRVIALAEHLKRELDLRVCMDSYIYLPDEAWHQFPPNFLSNMERSLVRADLRLCSYEEIMDSLHISRNTIHTYRTNIRSKFLAIEPEQRPVWMQIWLRLYPGHAGARRKERRGF